jgi:hypothetical protein
MSDLRSSPLGRVTRRSATADSPDVTFEDPSLSQDLNGTGHSFGLRLYRQVTGNRETLRRYKGSILVGGRSPGT